MAKSQKNRTVDPKPADRRRHSYTESDESMKCSECEEAQELEQLISCIVTHYLDGVEVNTGIFDADAVRNILDL